MSAVQSAPTRGGSIHGRSGTGGLNQLNQSWSFIPGAGVLSHRCWVSHAVNVRFSTRIAGFQCPGCRTRMPEYLVFVVRVGNERNAP